MSEDFLRKYQPGDKYSAGDANARRELHMRQHFDQAGADDPTVQGSRKSEENDNLVTMRNGTGADRLQYEVAGISDIMFDPTSDLNEFKYGIWVKGVMPAQPTHNGKFGVFQDNVLDGKSDIAKVSGVTQVQVDILETTDTYCDIKNGVATELESNSTGGATILAPNPPAATGIQWCIVRIEGPSFGIWYFELAAELVQWTDPVVPVGARRRVWDPADSGSFVTDCDQSILVGDYAGAGFYGEAGANGWAEMRMSDAGLVGIIRGLNCPDACVCGTDYTETPPCA